MRGRLQELLALADALALPAVASGDVHMHARGRRALQDTITAIRHRSTIADAGARLFPNGERHLRTRRALAAIYPRHLLDETLRIAERCTFSLRKLRIPLSARTGARGPHADDVAAPTGGSRRARALARGEDAVARELIEKELALIADKQYEAFFLTVHDVVRYARAQGILCQGRGSAANSVVCYALGITAIDPARMGLLFERFLSKERDEPPDIDVDFEHERREEVIQYIYRRYGRERAALAATVIRYRTRSAVRDVARALGLPEDQLAQLSRSVSVWSSDVPAAGAPARARLRPRQPGDAPAAGAGRRTARQAAPPVAARRRLRDLRGAAAHAGAGRERGDARPHHHPVGQGRPRGARPAQGRRARAGHADLHPQGAGPGAPASRRRITRWRRFPPRTRRPTK